MTCGIEEPASASTRKPASPGADAFFWMTTSATSSRMEPATVSKTRNWFVDESGWLKFSV